MLADSSQVVVMPRFAVADETRASARYRWSCQDRGPDPFVIMQWTRSGAGVFRCDGRDHPVPSGHAFVALVPEPAEYRFEPGATEPWRFAWINFYGALGLQLWRALRTSAGPVFALPTGSAAGLAFEQLIVDTCGQRFADRFEASAAAYHFYMLLSRQLESPAAPFASRGGTASSVRRLAGGSLGGPSAGLKSFASEAGVTREHFSRVFKAELGESPARFLRRQRLRAADEMLRTTTLPLRETALRCGFTSARHLADAYRARDGHLPTRCRPTGKG